jgi:hypothetical protein
MARYPNGWNAESAGCGSCHVVFPSVGAFDAHLPCAAVPSSGEPYVLCDAPADEVVSDGLFDASVVPPSARSAGRVGGAPRVAARPSPSRSAPRSGSVKRGRPALPPGLEFAGAFRLTPDVVDKSGRVNPNG